MRSDFGVLGGGIIGLATAWQLARRGARVTVYNAAHARAATGAAAGMLAAQCEMARHAPDHSAESYFDFCLHSRALYPELLNQLSLETGRELPVQHGIRYIATRDDDGGPAALRAGGARGLAVEESNWRGAPALWLPQEGAVEPPVVAVALRAALLARGASFESGIDSIEGIVHAGACGRLVVCGGAWSAQVLSARTGAPDDWIRPITGLTIEARSEAVREVLYSSDCYIVPRGDGRLVIGATSEECGFDGTPTLAAANRLLSAAAALEPGLGAAAILDWRVGLRPVSRDGLPVIGALDDTVFVATAHGRNGVLLAAATAELVANALLDGVATPEEFSPHRFTCVSS